MFPLKNVGTLLYQLRVKDVPVDGFWPVTAYAAEGDFAPTDLNAYSINSITGIEGEDGSITIQFGGGTAEASNCLSVTDGWDYIVCLYRPRPEILGGSWSFRLAELIN